MEIRRSQFVILVIVVLFGVVAAKYFFKAKSPFKDECYSSFEDFAYRVPYDTKYETKSDPLSPWEVESELPGLEIRGTINLWLSVAATRLMEGYTEVLVKQYPRLDHYQDRFTNFYQFFVYRTDTREWKSVPAQVDGTNLYVTQIFVTDDGQMWGKNIWDFTSRLEGQPMLSKYDELTGKFEPVESTRSIPNGVVDTDPRTVDSSVWTETFLDSNNLFWFVVQRDAIYSFDPATSEVTRHADLKEVYLKEAALAPNGIIYIT